MANRSYSETEKKAALDIYAELGPAEASRRMGIPSGTIRSWAKRTGATVVRGETARANVEAARLTWAQRRADLTLQLGEAAQEFLDRSRKSTGAQVARTHMGSCVAAIEKAQLLDGSATERVEVSGEQARERVKELRDELEQRRQAKTAGGS